MPQRNPSNALVRDIYNTAASTKTHAEAVTNYVADMPAINRLRRTTSIGDLRFAFFDRTSLSWFAVGASKHARRSLRLRHLAVLVGTLGCRC